MNFKLGIGLIGLLLLSSCASIPSMTDSCTKGVMKTNGICSDDPETVELPTHQKLKNLPPAKEKPIIAVYKFLDKTGQRKQKGDAAMFSTAVSQGTETMLIDALKTASDGNWFRVVERVGIDHLTRERQIVRSTREAYGEEKKLAPLLFAGIILEGGIVGYDTNIETGGRGARYLGVGMHDEYRKDMVSVGIRLISVNTGEVLLAVSAHKTILSTKIGVNVFRFLDMGTKLLETEIGFTQNESITYAVRKAIEASVVELILEGEKTGLWEFEEEQKE